MDLTELPILTDPKAKQLGSLLQRMTGDNSQELKFTDSQVNSMIEVFIPRFVTGCPGMPDGMGCVVNRKDGGWTVEIELPENA